MKRYPSRPLILMSNDDGYTARGASFLIEALSDFGDIISICPDGPRSGQSMAITVNGALRITDLGSPRLGVKLYSVNGTPVDCIKLAMHTIVPRTPDLVVSGVNHGSNASVNVCYSGTMGAVMEGCAAGIPSIGFSLTDHSSAADFNPCRPFIRAITQSVLLNGLPKGVCLNVNIPAHCVPTEMRLVREARGKWSDEYQRYTSPSGHDFYMLSGHFVNEEPEAEDTDEWCLKHGIVSVVPEMFERTAPFDGLGWLRETCSKGI